MRTARSPNDQDGSGRDTGLDARGTFVVCERVHPASGWISEGGRCYFSLERDQILRHQAKTLRRQLVQKVLESRSEMAKPGYAPKDESALWPREDEFCWPHHLRGDRKGAKGDQGVPPWSRLQDLILEARVYWDQRGQETNPTISAKWEAFGPVIQGDVPLIVAAEMVPQIRSAVAFAVRDSLRLIIDGGYEVEACATMLREHRVPVINAGVHRLPRRRDEPY